MRLEHLVNFNPGVTNQVVSAAGGTQLIATIDPRLTALGLAQYPHLPLNTDPTRVEEIRRTLYIGNLDSKISPSQVLKFFNNIGEVKYIRMAGDDTQPTIYAFVEFTHQTCVANAIQYNGSMLGSRALKINHSNNAIVKPQSRAEKGEPVRRSRDRSSTSRDRHRSSSRYDKDRVRDRDKPSRSHRSRSRDHSPQRRRSRSREYISRKGRSKGDDRRKSWSRDSRRRRSRSRSHERSRSRRHRR